jgi:hypothetical protein
LDEWYNVKPLKAEIEGMLDTLYPDPVGYKPGETLLQREHPLMPEF